MSGLNYHAKTPDVSGLTVMSVEKEVVDLESLWRDRRIVLVFLRHFG